jgi:hemoglobin-like flavoprotein
MTLEQKRLVQDTYALLRPVLDLLGDIFYSRLFEVDPTLRHLFPPDIGRQGEKLVAAIGAAVAGLDRIDELERSMEDLGVLHAGYGVKSAHYDTVEQALLWTLRMGLGAAFTAEVREAWAAVYGMSATAMKRGATRQVVALG